MGETLRQRMESAPQQRIKLNEALEVATQVSTALAAAHEAGIVHRDIKPENVMLRPDGLVKVLDFGLAKLTESYGPAIDTEAPTIGRASTESGLVMGTPRYMSPEQARGQRVDPRTDIFSLGVMLYEMIGGSAPFAGKSSADIIVAILDKEPVALAHHLPGVPGELERIVSKALRKEREDRYQVIKDMLVDLKDLKRELERAAEVGRAHRPDEGRGRRAAWGRWGVKGAAAVGAMAVVAAVWYWLVGSGAGIKEALPLKNASFTQLTDQPGPEYFPSLSPDGKSFVYAIYASGNWDVYLQRVGGKNPINLTKDSPSDDTQPAFSPDGERIAFRSERGGGGIFVMGATGENVKRLTNFGFNPVWSPDGKYLYFVSDRGGSMNLWRAPIDEQSGKVMGPPEAVTTPSPYSAHLSFSRDGRHILYAQIVSRANIQQIGFDPKTETVTGQPIWITQGSRWANTPNLSPDGEWLAFDAQGGNPEGLFVVRRDGTGLRRLIEGINKDRRPNWSPDGRRIAFFSDRSGKWEIWMINPDGSDLQMITQASGTVTNPVWSPDGTRLAYRNAGSPPSVMEVGKPWEEQERQTLPSVGDSINFTVWGWSREGRRLAGWQQQADGRLGGILVYSFETQQYEKLTDFGITPVWLSDSRRLLFQDKDKIFLVDSQAKRVREVLSVTPHNVGIGVTLSRDDRLIYFSLVTTEADIWLMTLG